MIVMTAIYALLAYIIVKKDKKNNNNFQRLVDLNKTAGPFQGWPILKQTKTNTMQKQIPSKTQLVVNKSYQGETIEKKINRIVNNKEPIKDATPIIFTERSDGVIPEYDPRDDKWERAAEARDKIAKMQLAKRQGTDKGPKIGEEAKKNMEKENGGAEPTQATDQKK